MTPITPHARDLKEVYNAGRSQVAWTTLVADLETPVSAYLKLARDKANVFLLESVAGGAIRERYSFIGMNPDMIWRCFGNRAEINRRPAEKNAGFAPCPVSETEGAIASLRALVAESAIKDMPSTLPPMAAGLIGYMAYDTVRLVEKIPAENPDRLGLPDGLFIRPTVIAVFDTVEDTITIATPVRPKAEASADQACSSAFDRLRNAISILEGPLPHDDGAFTAHRPEPIGEPAANMTTRDYCAMVEKAKEYILAGDIFQVVLSQRFSVPFALPALALYRSLRRLNPSPFLFLLNFGDFAVVGSSPEILVRVRDGKATIRPIAGTRPRGGTEEEDKALAEDLLNDPKELSEHLMLLDLGRNDMGRVAKIGTVTVTKDHFIEYYSHVMHIVSNIEGELDDSRHDALRALFAGFPAGTVSGAPKVRAMEIIEELEPDKRGVYAGCIGYFGANGDMDSCIALRTAIVKDGRAHVQAGAGIVMDSVPEKEDEECRNKARAIIGAVEDAVFHAANRAKSRD